VIAWIALKEMMMTLRDLYQAGTVCRQRVTLGVDGKTYTWEEPCRFLFVRGPYPTLEGGEIGESGPVQQEFWYEAMSDIVAAEKERFYTLEPLETWY
jgi:hypothetical protein